MTPKQQSAMQQALEALKATHYAMIDAGLLDQDRLNKNFTAHECLRAALAEPVQEPVTHFAIADALFDFMGWLTSRSERIVLSSADDAAPAVKAITEFAKMRGLSLDEAALAEPVQEPVAYIHRQGRHWEVSERPLTDDEKARGWTEEPLYTAPPQSKPLSDEEIEALLPEPDGTAEVDTVRVLVAPGLCGTEYTEADAWKKESVIQVVRAVEAKLKEKNT